MKLFSRVLPLARKQRENRQTQGIALPLKVLVVDDRSFIRDALVDLFATTDDIDVIGQCSDGDQVLTEVDKSHPDVVLMDVEMPHVDGIQAMRQVLAAHPEVSVVLLTDAPTPGTAREVRALGAAGYLRKGDDPDELPERIRAAATGGSAWSSADTAIAEEG